MRVFFFLFSTLYLIASCSEINSPGSPLDYYPPSKDFRKGVVNKYYTHFYPNDKNRGASTNISYTLLTQISDEQFTVHTYNTGFELTNYNEFRVRDASIFLDSSSVFFGFANLDTASTEIRSAAYEQWDETEPQEFIEFRRYGEEEYEIRQTQTQTFDSLIMEKEARIILGNREVKYLNLDTVFESKYANIYVKGLGLYSALSTRSNGRFVRELVEQMPKAVFDELVKNKVNRVAYIDPESTYDDIPDFKICGHESEIADYYNSNEDVRYIDDKSGMMKVIRSKVIREQLKGDSGYLTFRFVVNCEGEPGRYVFEQSSLDYGPKQFSKTTIDHLYQITRDLKKWRPSVVREEPRDAYVYLTYKIQNGFVTDVLP